MDDAARIDMDEHELGLAVERSMFDLFRAMTALDGAELAQGQACSWHHAWPENPMFKGVWGLTGTADEIGAAVDEALARQAEPVATAMLAYGAGVATLLAIGTVERARGRGIGAAITLAPLVEARARGFRHAVLFATDAGAPVYRRIGFHDTGTFVSRWLWRPA